MRPPATQSSALGDASRVSTVEDCPERSLARHFEGAET